MGKYRITSPEGVTLEIEGEQPPTEQELEHIFSQFPGGNAGENDNNSIGQNIADVASHLNPFSTPGNVDAVTQYLTTGNQPEYNPGDAGTETTAGAFLSAVNQPARDLVNGVENIASFAIPDQMKQNIMDRRTADQEQNEIRSERHPIANVAGYMAGSLPLMAGGVPAAMATGGVIGAGENANINDYSQTGANAALGMALAGVGEYAGGKLADNVFPAVRDKISDTVSPVLDRVFRSPESSANRALARIAGDTDANQIMGEMDALRGTGADITLADTPTFKGAGQGAAAMPENSTYATAFETRQAEAGDRIKNIIHESTGKNGAGYNSSVKAINKIRSEQAKPYYDAVRDQPVQLTEGLQTTMDTPAFNEAANEAVKMAKNDMVNINLDDEVQPVVFWDYVKRALDDDIGVANRQGRGNTVRQLSKIKNSIVGEIDQQYPAYAKARSIWSESSGLLNAGEEGTKFLKTDIDDLRNTFNGLSEAERDEFKLGAVKAIEKELDKLVENANAGHRLTRSKEMQNRLGLLFEDPAEAKDLVDSLMIEKRLTGTFRDLYQGSQTAQRSVAKDSLEEGADLRNLTMDVFKLDSRPEFRAALGEKLFTPQSPDQISRILGSDAKPGPVAEILKKAGGYAADSAGLALKKGARFGPYSLDSDPLYRGAMSLNRAGK